MDKVTAALVFDAVLQEMMDYCGGYTEFDARLVAGGVARRLLTRGEAADQGKVKECLDLTGERPIEWACQKCAHRYGRYVTVSTMCCGLPLRARYQRDAVEWPWAMP